MIRTSLGIYPEFLVPCSASSIFFHITVPLAGPLLSGIVLVRFEGSSRFILLSCIRVVPVHPPLFNYIVLSSLR
ncbi:hypothetical protein M407DRAFT_102397 [Tulasnella calospora MUT 4182]|uniref:Uncharacterized protein n=1 Tax=Tulasnella calospora MUT 4182 TaxID=1051891 RepID=A0A0C3LSM2_9AGAM|nr:hypothetical protein M407DRAFT_102397 [Tulasnella calospora MUT 4182]